MAVPKKKRSKSKTRMKKAAWQLTAPNLRPCPSCGELGHSHRACLSCGYYKGKQVIKIKTAKKAKKED